MNELEKVSTIRIVSPTNAFKSPPIKEWVKRFCFINNFSLNIDEDGFFSKILYITIKGPASKISEQLYKIDCFVDRLNGF